MNKKTKLWYLSNINLFQGMSPKEMKWVEGKTNMKHYVKGENLYSTEGSGEQIYFLKEGSVKLSTLSPDGQEFTREILRPGDLFGELMPDNRSKFLDESYAQAMEETIICAMSERNFEELLRMKPNLTVRLVKLMGLKLRTIEAKLTDLVFKSVRERLAGLLVKLAEEFGQKFEGFLRIGTSVAHQEMANLIGSSRETTTLTLNEFKRAGIIEIKGREIFIKNISRLKF
ncbi:Crp/Fnr family transcriptional regulator [Candidatus Saganbacteria bacterium]|nr:Crp/Fnr family transcriptional regulator [Candidatus Saganbacteria bacterium]